MASRVEDRHAVRALLISPEDELLLIKCVEPASGKAYWLTPGGGLEKGESPRGGLERELREETGLTGTAIGPCVWTRVHTFGWGGRTVRQSERFYQVNVERFEPTARYLPEAAEIGSFVEFRWWKAEEIARSSDMFVPRHLASLFEDFLENGPLPAPRDVGE